MLKEAFIVQHNEQNEYGQKLCTVGLVFLLTLMSFQKMKGPLQIEGAIFCFSLLCF